MPHSSRGASEPPSSGVSTPSIRNGARPKGRKTPQKPAPPAPTRTIGPVSDLERHLPADWWRTLFNSLYLKTDGDVVENEQNTRQDIDMVLRTVTLEPNDRILDLCCGQGRHALELARRGYRNVVGVDRSRYLIRLARRRAKQEVLPVSFHEGDARTFRLPESSFHCVTLMGNSFGYFDQEDQDLQVLKSIFRVLRSNGTVLLDLADGEWLREHFERRSWEWIDENHFVCRERSLSSEGNRLITREVVVHAERGVIADQFYAERLYTRDGILDLLDRAGFQNARIQASAATQSDRNQDLGMMAHRMLVVAQMPAKPQKKKTSAIIDIGVIMGDPTLPDTVKRGGKFNAEDFETIDRLKKALSELEGYRFRYFDRHATMLSDLRANPPAVALNLCDEGFNNNAFFELHVPAMLEMLGVPYTGAGPSCLGLCYNKAMVRSIAASLDVPVPLETYCGSADQAATIPSSFPALVKPNFGDSSIGITKNAVVHSSDELMNYLEHLRNTLPGVPVLLQEYLTGSEFSIAVIGNPGIGYTVLPPLEVDFSGLPANLPKILSYESKWEPDSPYWTQISYKEAEISDEELRPLVDASTLMFERLGCRDYARFDFRADSEGVIKLLEVNPNPGWCWDGKLNLMAEFAGLRYADLLKMILDAAVERVEIRGDNRRIDDGGVAPRPSAGKRSKNGAMAEAGAR